MFSTLRVTFLTAFFAILSVSAMAAEDGHRYSINLGDKAPDFTLPNAHGEEKSLSDFLKDGPVILSFYRGGWCPICNEQLQTYQQDLQSFKDLGAQLVAISPEKPESAQDTATRHSLQFEVLSDKGNEVARLYDVVWSVPEDSREQFDQWLVDTYGKALVDFNGLDSYELPIPATFIIRPDGKIAFLFRDQNAQNRVKNTDLVTALKN